MIKKSLLKNSAMARLGGCVAVGMVVLGAFGSSQALAQIVSTKHNLGSTGTGTNKAGPTGTTEICVFCHTPHGASTTVAAPLWNRTMPATTDYGSYSTLGSASLDGASVVAAPASVVCLSCHDGTQALNSVINAPGSGNPVGWSGTWQGATNITGMANLGANLNNDHPIGIQYGGGMANNAQFTKGTIAAGALRDADFKAVQYQLLNNNDVWWIDTPTGALGARQKTDMQLYTRSGVTALNGASGTTTGGTVLTGAQAFVECGSCHDPHMNQPLFLRVANTGSAVCLACHTK